MEKNVARESLDRFLGAQSTVYSAVRAELAAGAKTSHWMWFVFPQLKGLGQSPTAIHFGLASLEEAQAYWQHPVLGQRLRECTELVLAVEAKSALDIFGAIDAMKFRSCMTLFGECVPGERLFGNALSRFYSGAPDERTFALLASSAGRASRG